MHNWQEIYPELRQQLDNLWIVDTHEHLVTESFRLSQPTDVFNHLMGNYLPNDILNAGCPMAVWKQCIDSKRSLAERWKLFEPYWNLAKNTGMAMAFSRIAADIYGVDKVDLCGLEKIQQKMEAETKPGMHNRILRDWCHIAVAIVGSVDKGYFEKGTLYRQRLWTLPFTGLSSRQGILDIEQKTGQSINSFNDLEDALDHEFRWAMTEASPAMCAIKLSQIMRGPLTLAPSNAADAEKSFEKIAKLKKDPKPFVTPDGQVLPHFVSPPEAIDLQNYLIGRYLEFAAEQGWPVQIHTGFPTAWLDIRWGDPTLLQDIIRHYPKTKFDIFHTAWPFWQDLICMAKYYHNCYVNMCWTHIMSPVASRAALSELLVTVPLNKILVFGGDYKYAESIYGHLQIALDNTAIVLAEKVAMKCITMEEAIRTAKFILTDGPSRFYGFQEILEGLADHPNNIKP